MDAKILLSLLCFSFLESRLFHISKGVFLEMVFVFDIRSTLVITLPLVQLESGTPANNLPTVNQRCPQQTQTILIQGVFFNWASPEFAKCWSVSN